MAKIIVGETCVGCGLCEQNCPELFKVEDDGLAHVIGEGSACSDLQDLVAQCPVEAIKVEQY